MQQHAWPENRPPSFPNGCSSFVSRRLLTLSIPVTKISKFLGRRPHWFLGPALSDFPSFKSSSTISPTTKKKTVNIQFGSLLLQANTHPSTTTSEILTEPTVTHRMQPGETSDRNCGPKACETPWRNAPKRAKLSQRESGLQSLPPERRAEPSHGPNNPSNVSTPTNEQI